jgi:LacI family transcriptional regulator
VVRASSAAFAGGDPLVARALAYMRERIAEPPAVAALARHCGASRRTLELRFRRTLNVGPAAELRRRRIAHAELLLSETDLPLAAIAEATGFSHAAHFSALFRKVRGMTPGAWRRHPKPDSSPPMPLSAEDGRLRTHASIRD